MIRRFNVLLLGLVLGLASCSSGGDGDAAPGNADTPGGGEPAIREAAALFVLGDSLSDVGNAAAMADYLLDRRIRPPTVGLCTATDVLVESRSCEGLFHRKSRVSDGPVAVEHLAAHFGLDALVPSTHLVPSRPVEGPVYAVAGAKARGRAEKDLARQVDALLLDRAPLDAEAVYVVMIGGNDAIDALQAEIEDPEAPPDSSGDIVTAAVDAIGASVERLLDRGARKLVVANVPDLATLPAVRADARARADAAGVLERASAISASFDRELDARLDEIEGRDQWLAPTPPEIVRFDLRAALEAEREAVAASGGNAVNACFDSETYRESSQRSFHPECAPAGDAAPRFGEFVFWDGIHPTGAAHEALGEALVDSL